MTEKQTDLKNADSRSVDSKSVDLKNADLKDADSSKLSESGLSESQQSDQRETGNSETGQTRPIKPLPDPAIRRQRNRIRFIIFLLILLPLTFRYFTKNDILGTLTNIPYAKVLIAVGADVNSQDHSGLRPIFHASIKGRDKMLRFFIEQGADVKQTCSNGKVDGLTALHYAPNEQIATILLEAGADPDAVTSTQTAPIHLAAYNSRIGVVKVLLEKGAKPSLPDGSGRTALHETAFRNDSQTATLLLDHKADINFAALDGNTPLHEAVIWHNTALVELLLSRGAQKDLKNKSGFTPLAIAIKEKVPEIIELLQKDASESKESVK